MLVRNSTARRCPVVAIKTARLSDTTTDFVIELMIDSLCLPKRAAPPNAVFELNAATAPFVTACPGARRMDQRSGNAKPATNRQHNDGRGRSESPASSASAPG
jgi:hypothetical protein